MHDVANYIEHDGVLVTLLPGINPAACSMIIIFTVVIISISTWFTLYILSRRRGDAYDVPNNNNINVEEVDYLESDDDAELAYIVDDDDGSGEDKTIILITGGAGVLGWRVASMCKERFPSDTTEVSRQLNV